MSWALADVVVEHVASTLPVDAGVDALVDEAWSRQQARAAARGRTLTDGPAYRLERYAAHGGGLVLGLALVDYRRHSAFKDVHDRVGPEHHDRALVVDALVTTTDDAVALLRTDKPVGTELQLVGGTATPAQRGIVDTEDLAQFARERVARALPGCGDVEVRSVLGVVEQEIGCRNVVVDARLDVASGDLRTEHGSELVLVPRHALRDFLVGGPAYLPAVAAFL